MPAVAFSSLQPYNYTPNGRNAVSGDFPGK